MQQEEFEDTLRHYLRRRPFFPFFVEMADGSLIEIDAPNSVAMGGGAAGFLNARGEPTFFNCEDVRRIAVASAEAPS